MVSFLIGLSFIHGITARAKQAAGVIERWWCYIESSGEWVMFEINIQARLA
ncbi:hypothetical protein [Vreelandella lionensis]|uniref:hypothetical protein n=1 Tax=Vreelandella lionensis TaxID=1144478 RepID=UPI00137479F9|nr:hypothetical protein [Halomonas lionensis]